MNTVQISQVMMTIAQCAIQTEKNASQFDQRLFRSKVISIDKSRFDQRQESVRSKTVTIA